jgi:hypothetical protein
VVLVHIRHRKYKLCCSGNRQYLINKHRTASQRVQEAIDAVEHSADARDFLLSVKDVHNIKRNHAAVHFKQHQNDAVSLSIMV